MAGASSRRWTARVRRSPARAVFEERARVRQSVRAKGVEDRKRTHGSLSLRITGLAVAFFASPTDVLQAVADRARRRTRPVRRGPVRRDGPVLAFLVLVPLPAVLVVGRGGRAVPQRTGRDTRPAPAPAARQRLHRMAARRPPLVLLLALALLPWRRRRRRGRGRGEFGPVLAVEVDDADRSERAVRVGGRRDGWAPGRARARAGARAVGWGVGRRGRGVGLRERGRGWDRGTEGGRRFDRDEAPACMVAQRSVLREFVAPVHRGLPREAPRPSTHADGEDTRGRRNALFCEAEDLSQLLLLCELFLCRPPDRSRGSPVRDSTGARR